mgnify:CR=1 FL=1
MTESYTPAPPGAHADGFHEKPGIDAEVQSPTQSTVAEPVLEGPEETPSLASPEGIGEIQPTAERTFGRYELLIEMASGGMATLYLARILGPQDFEKLIAIKRIHPHLAKKPSFVHMFLDEARIAARIHHPNVVTTFDMGQIDGAYFIAMEYVHGQNLTDVLRTAIREPSKLPWQLVVRMLADAASGLHAAHELTSDDGKNLGVVHRDVSPQNILVSYDGHVKVTDFGIAFAAKKLEQTESGILKGKVSYMSPEQTRGEPVTRRSDIFALGIVLWEALCLKRLFRTPNEASTLLRVREAKVPRLQDVRPELPAALEAIVSKALARRPEDRFATAEELSEALEKLLVDQGRVVTRKHIAASISSLFDDRRRLKDLQIQEAKGSALASPAKGVGMGAGTGSLELLTEAKGELSKAAPRRSRWPWVAAISVVVVALGSLLLLRSTTCKPPQPGKGASSAAIASRRDAPMAPPSADAQAIRPRPPSKVKLSVRIAPEGVAAEIVFRDKVFDGKTFEQLLTPSQASEKLTVRAAGYVTQTLFVVLSADTVVPVTLEKEPEEPRRQPPRLRPRRHRPSGGLRDLPE